MQLFIMVFGSALQQSEIVHLVHVASVSNLADFLTKPLGAVAFWRVVKPVLFQTIVWKDTDIEMSNNLKMAESKSGFCIQFMG
jgi:hypothetical protein